MTLVGYMRCLDCMMECRIISNCQDFSLWYHRHPVYTVRETCDYDIDFGHIAVIFTLATFSTISCY